MNIQVEVCIQNGIKPTDSALQSSSPPNQAHNYFREEIDSIMTYPWHGWMQQWLDQLQPNLSPIQAYELSLRLTDDQEIHKLNAQYRQQNNPTDVLAFAALEGDYPATEAIATEPLYLGDIIISVETAHRQAIAQGHTLMTELVWLASHGLLHLLGWDHPDAIRLEEMLTQQKALLNTVGVSI